MSIKVNTYNQKAEAKGKKELSAEVFGRKPSEALIHQVMVAQMSNERQVLAHTKDKSEVRGGGRKPWKQKGTGRARAGSNRSPIWKGGGVTFGPTKERNFKKDVNKKMKRNALCMILSDRVQSEKMFVVDTLNLENFKTKMVDGIVSSFENCIKDENKKRSFLIINDASDEKFKYSSRNLKGVKMINKNNINILDLIKYKNLLITEKSVEALEAMYSKQVD